MACCSPWGHKRVGHDLASEQQIPTVGKYARDEMWGSSLRWKTLAEDQDGAGGKHPEFRRERNKDVFLKGIISVVCFCTRIHSKTY